MQSTAPTYVVRAIKSEHHTALLEEVSGSGIIICEEPPRKPWEDGDDWFALWRSSETLQEEWTLPDAPMLTTLGRDAKGRDLVVLYRVDTLGQDAADAFEHLATIAPNF